MTGVAQDPTQQVKVAGRGRGIMAQTNIIGRLSEFDPAILTWEMYQFKLDQFFSSNRITDDGVKRAHIFSSIGAKNERILWNGCSPDTPASKTYVELCEILKNHYVVEKIEIAERFELYKRKQLSGETIKEFVEALRELTKYCKFPVDHLANAIRDQLVFGLANKAIQQQLLMEPSLTLEKAIALAESLTSATNSSLLQQKANIEVNQVHQARTCYRCGSWNHHPDRCHFKDEECYACHKKGHTKLMCRIKGGARFKRAPIGRAKAANYVELEPSKNDEEDTEVANYLSFIENQPSGIHTVKDYHEWSTSLYVNGKCMVFEVDTGSSRTLISEKSWRELGSPELVPVSTGLNAYSGVPLCILGGFMAKIEMPKLTAECQVLVVKGNGPALLGRDFLVKFNLLDKSS